MKENVKTIEGNEIEINCRFLLPRKAEQILESSIKITEMVPVLLEGEEVKESHKLIGEFSGMIGVKGKALDYVIQDCPQKDEICVEDRNRIYEKYAKKILDDTMKDTLSPNS